jgi:hypothetical protein
VFDAGGDLIGVGRIEAAVLRPDKVVPQDTAS